MGRPLPIDDQAIEELKMLSPVAKEYLGHHINNCLQLVLSCSEAGNKDLIRSAVFHIVEDLKRFGG